MMHLIEWAGFWAMLIAPCAIALSGRRTERMLEEKDRAQASELANRVEPVAVPVAPVMSRELRPSTASISRLMKAAAALEANGAIEPEEISPVAVKEVVADQASARKVALQALRAEAEAAKARATDLSEASRLAARRADLAARLSDAAGEELERARLANASAAFTRTGSGSFRADGRLPSDHPSLDFPRAKASDRRAA